MAKISSPEHGHTLIETFIVVAILGLSIGAIFSIAEISSKIWSEGKVISELRSDTRAALHILTSEIRESSLATIFLGPSTTGPPYNAISMGHAKRGSGSGLICLDASDTIIWDNVIIYHTYDNPDGGAELCKSVLDWDNNLTDSERQAQVNSYVNSSDGRVIIKNLQAGGGGLLNFSTEEYDHWLETYFSDQNIVLNKTVVSGGNVFLDGGGQAWFVGSQSGDDIPEDFNNSSYPASSYRILIKNDYLFKSGSRVRFKFVTSATGTGDYGLNISSPSLAETDSANSRNIVDDTRSFLYFNSSTGKTMTNNETAWTDWLSWEDAAGDVFSKNKNYSITYYSDTTQTFGNFNVRKWIDISSAETQEFLWSETDASSSPLDWGTSGTTQNYLVGLEEIEVSYCSSGTLTSQIYNTGVDNPIYDKLSWNETVPQGTDISIKVRSHDSATMAGATSWSALTAFTAGADNDISNIGTGRYIQFQATLTSSSPYNQTPVLQDITFTWKGGIVSITVDRSYNYRGKLYSVSMSSDAKPKNK